MGKHPILVAKSADRVLAWASLSSWSDRCAYRDCAEISTYVEPSHQGRGIGKALTGKIIAQARKSGLHTLIARISDGNQASINLYRSLGFKRVGVMEEVGFKFGRFIDVHMYQLLLRCGLSSTLKC
jgi:L-amino acid N-acyltransferase